MIDLKIIPEGDIDGISDLMSSTLYGVYSIWSLVELLDLANMYISGASIKLIIESMGLKLGDIDCMYMACGIFTIDIVG